MARIKNKRVISNDRVRKVRTQKNKIIIAVEGKNKSTRVLSLHCACDGDGFGLCAGTCDTEIYVKIS